MPSLPAIPFLTAYWLNSELTNTFPAPSLHDVLCYTRRDGSPQLGVIYLVGAALTGSPENFQAPYLSFAPSLLNTLQNGNVGLLQQAGVSVSLCIQGSDGMGWGSMDDAQAQAFAAWIGSEVVGRYGLDGIDIDDEYSVAYRTSQQLVNTVAWLNSTLPDTRITKALWSDTDDFVPKATTSPYAGRPLSDMLRYGSTMVYGDDAGYIEAQVATYDALGMAGRQFLGVQAGPAGQNGMTSLGTTADVAAWVKENGHMGMMLWSFSQDISQFTTNPQQSVPFPSAGDHLWQQTIIEAWGGPSDFVVDTAGLRGIYYPEGSFSETCTDVRLILTADLERTGGTWVEKAAMNITPLTTADLTNNEGSFGLTDVMLGPDDVQSIRAAMKKDGLGDFVPVGSYFRTAQKVSVDLMANCRDRAGVFKPSTLNLSQANFAETIVENVDGVLTLRPIG